MFKRLVFVVALLSAMVSAVSCGSRKSDASEVETVAADSIVIVYYSQTGNTREVANALRLHLGEQVPMVEIVPVEPYSADYDATVARWKVERDSNITVEIEPVDVDMSKYSTVFLGFPVWGGTVALPVKTYLEQNDLSGKKIVTFATFGSGGLASATREVAELQPEAEVLQGYGIRAARVGKAFGELDRFLIENNYKEGVLEALGDYSEPTILNQDAIEVFEAACSGYKYPLGTPVKVSFRATPVGTDYRYEVENVGPDGETTTSTIYVTKEKGDSVVPEFTEVVRH